ncbi:LOW QUALITY PROTEIN: rho guanine nucleotide exchange factor at 64C [Amblyomma americanum]
MSKMRQPKYGTLSAVPVGLYGDPRCYGSVRGCCRRPGCTCGRRPEIDDAALYYHVLGASSLGAASLGRASLGRGHAPRRRSAASVVHGGGAAADVYLAAAADPLLRKLNRKDRFSSVSSRRSILECDVTAYDLIKKYLRTPAAPDSDDDDLNCNVLLNGGKKNGSSAAIKPGSPPSRQSPAKNAAVSRPPASLELWPEEPDPDYDEDSDVGLEAGRFKDLKISYSPPLVRKVSAPAAAKTRAEASSSCTRRSQSCSPVRPAAKSPTLSSQPRGILKKKKAPERKSLNATHRGRSSHGTYKKVTFQEGSECASSQAWEEEPWENPHEARPEAKKTRPRLDSSWEAVATKSRPATYVNGQSNTKRRHATANGATEGAQTRKSEAAAVLKADSKFEPGGDTYAERRLPPREERKAGKAELKLEQRFNTQVRVRGNHKVEVKPQPRIDIRIEHTSENQSPKLDQKSAVVPVSSAVSVDSEPDRQYHQVNGSFYSKGEVSVNCDVRSSSGSHGTNINIVPCSEEKGISLEVNGNDSPCSSYDADADYEVISSYNSQDTKLAGNDAGKVAVEAESKVTEKKYHPLQEGVLREGSGDKKEECKSSIQETFEDEYSKDARDDRVKSDTPDKTSETPQSPQLVSPPLSPKPVSYGRDSPSERYDGQVTSNHDVSRGCKQDVVIGLEASNTTSKTEPAVKKSSKPQAPPVPTQTQSVPEAGPEKTSLQVSDREDVKGQVFLRQEAESVTENAPLTQGPEIKDASKSTRPECPARKKHDVQNTRTDVSKDHKSPQPREGKLSQQRNTKADTRIYQKVGVKVLPTKAEATSDLKLSLPMEHRISRPLSPPPPIPAGSASPRRVSADELLPEGSAGGSEQAAGGTVMVTTQTSTGTRVLISSHGRLSGSYPVRRSPAKRRPRMRHSAPQLDGDSARALFAPLSLVPPAAAVRRRSTPPKESTSTFYVSLSTTSSSGSSELRAEEEADVRGPEAQDGEEEPVYADTLPSVACPPTPDGPIYDDCEVPPEPVYEELPEHPPQPQHREKKLLSFESPQKSFFEGASKADILGYLEDAKERGLENLVGDTVSFEALAEDAALDKIPTGADVERNDSGIGGDRYSEPLDPPAAGNSEEQRCADCDQQVTGEEELVCPKCEKKRTERREIITEIVQTELKYGHDLRIIKEEFYKPIETAGLLTKQQLEEIFLNLDELMEVNASFAEKLQDALDIASEQGDEEYTTVDIGKLFLAATGMLQAYQTYCVRQASASLSLMAQEKEKELLRIFLRVSQMENTLLRRMNLAAFLMAPVQRVTKYPLLLSRLYKVTPYSHQDRESLRDAQLRVQLHLERINQLTREGNPTKIWRRISSISVNPRRAQNNVGVGSIKLRKMALDLLKWNRDETRFVLAGKLLVAEQPASSSSGRGVRFAALHGLLAVLGRPNSNYRPDLAHDNSLLFPRNTGIRDGALLLAKEKAGKFVLPREPLSLGSCIISCDPELKDCFEIQEYTSKEGFLFKAENSMETREWLKQLRYHAKDLGSWRRRRNGMANIMINGMDRY